MEIRIRGYVPASWLLQNEPNEWHALVMLDSGKQPTDFVKTHARSFMFLQFDDIEQPHPTKQPPTLKLVEQGLNFARGKEKLLVSCRAGQGRSVAMAYLISCEAHGVTEAIGLLNPTRHRPNRLVVEKGNTLLDNPDILRQFDAWRHCNSHIQLSDYYDEMEKEFDALVAEGACDRVTGE